MVSVPLRRGVSWFAATEKVTLPGPVPLAPDATVIQDASARAVHVQPAAVATDADPDPPLDPNVETEALTA
jgi:hypothetical protein